MPHGLFTSVSLQADGKLIVRGSTHEAESVSAMHIAVIAIDDPEQRSEAALIPKATAVASRLGPTWDAPTHAHSGDPFVKGDVVVAVGSATHDSADHPNPFLWHGFFKIIKEGEQGGEVRLRVA